MMRQTNLSCRRGGTTFGWHGKFLWNIAFQTCPNFFGFAKTNSHSLILKLFSIYTIILNYWENSPLFVVLGSRFSVITPSEMKAALYHTDDRSGLSTVLTVLRKRLRHLFGGGGGLFCCVKSENIHSTYQYEIWTLVIMRFLISLQMFHSRREISSFLPDGEGWQLFRDKLKRK